jgi:hypothetical protein
VARTDFKSVDEYVAAQPRGTRAILRRVRSAIRTALPGAEETISYQIPAYKRDGRTVLYFAGWKQHFSLYPATGRLVAAFKDDLAPYQVSKGTIRFPLSPRVPVRLIERIARFRAKESAARVRATPTKTGRAGATWATVCRLAMKLPGVEQGVSYGTPALRVRKRFLARLKEDGESMAIRLDFADRDVLIELDPAAFYLTDHYRPYPAVLVRLKRVRRDVLERLLEQAWRQQAPKAPRARERRRRQG